MDELFEREELSAAPDAGWPDCFNSGVFVFRPSEETYQSLLQFAVSQGSFDGKLIWNEISFGFVSVCLLAFAMLDRKVILTMTPYIITN